MLERCIYQIKSPDRRFKGPFISVSSPTQIFSDRVLPASNQGIPNFAKEHQLDFEDVWPFYRLDLPILMHLEQDGPRLLSRYGNRLVTQIPAITPMGIPGLSLMEGALQSFGISIERLPDLDISLVESEGFGPDLKGALLTIDPNTTNAVVRALMN
jgi:hypothetical protein